MSVTQFLFSLVFRADTQSAKSGAAEMRKEIAGVGAETARTSGVLAQHSAALDRDAAAADKAASSYRDMMMAQGRAHQETARAAGVPVGPDTTPLDDPKIDRMRARWVPLHGARRSYDRGIDDIEASWKAGAIDMDEAGEAIARLQSQYDRTTERIVRADGALRGKTETMAAATRAAQRLVGAQGGVGGAITHMLPRLNLARLGVLGVTGVVTGGVRAWDGYQRSILDVQAAAAGLGRAVALPAADMEAAARAGAAAAGISVREGWAMQAQFLRTGRVGAEHYEQLIGLSRDFAVTLGVDGNQARQMLAAMFADPVAASEALYQQYGLIDGAAARHAATLAAQGRTVEAQAVLIESMKDRLVDAEEATTTLGNAWAWVARNARDAYGAVGGAIDRAVSGPTLDQTITMLEGWRDEYTGSPYRDHRERLAEIERELRDLYARRDAQGERDRADAERQTANDLGRTALSIAMGSGANAFALREEQMRNDLAALLAGRGAPDQDDFQRGLIETDIETRTRLLEGMIRRQAIANELDRLDIAIRHERNPLIRAELEARRTRLQMMDQEVSIGEIEIAAARARNQAMAETIAGSRAEADAMRIEAETRAALTAQVAMGAMTGAEASEALQQELALRPLILAAAAAEGEERTRLVEVIRAMRDAYDLLARAERDQGGVQFLETQGARIEKLRFEQALIGEGTAARTRAMAAMEAEQQIRRLGIDAHGRMAEQMRTNALLLADEELALKRLADAWGTVQSSAERAIDGGIDKLLARDVKGALRGIGSEIAGLLADLALKNPLKNAILGSDLPTLQDAGGFLGRLMGGGGDTLRMAAGAATVPGMTVTTPVVHISTSNLSGLPLGTGLAPAANSPLAPGGAALGALQSVAIGGALRPDALTGLDGPFAGALAAMIGEAQALFGAEAVKVVSAFRSIERQAELWAEALAKYGTPEQARKWVAPPGSSNHNHGLAADLRYGGSDVQQWFHANAGRFGLDFRLGNEPWHIEPANVQAAKAQLDQFAATAEVAAGQLGTLGVRFETTATGLQAIGATFAQTLQMFGASKGPVGMIGASLLGGVLKSIGIPGFDRGGATGGSDPSRIAGFVHEEEFVFDAAATRRIGAARLEAMRRGSMPGYRAGGHVTGGHPPIPPAMAAAGGAPAPGGEAGASRTVFEINVRGTGPDEIYQGVTVALREAFEQFDRDALPGRVRMIMNDRWGDG